VYVHQGEQPDDPNDANDWLKHIVDISAGSNNSIALEADLSADPNSVFEGCVYTWGCNMWGEEPLDTMITDGRGLLGNGSDVNFSDTPVKVLRGEQDVNEPNQVYLKYIVAVSAGWDHLMALEKDDPYHPNLTLTGRVYTWGNNGRGWGGGTAAGWERSVGGKKSSKFSSFGLTWR
jgi:alpha-tubulin suppressor-like RCC1 family protein